MKLPLTSIVALTLVSSTWVSFAQEYSIARGIDLLNLSFRGFGQLSTNHYSISGITLTGTTVVDGSQNYIRQYGSVTIPGFALDAGSFHATQSLPPQFPNPPMEITADLTFSLSSQAITLPFDTGAVPLSWDGSKYNFGSVVNLALPIHQSVSFITGGITYGGTANGTLGISLDLSGPIGTDNYPTSIKLPIVKFSDTSTFLYDFTAPNGFRATAVVIAAPEPSSLALVGLGSLALVCMRRSRTAA